MITYLWIDFNKSICFNLGTDVEEDLKNSWGKKIYGNIDHDDSDIKTLIAYSDKLENNKSKGPSQKEFREAQTRLWQKISHDRAGWLISDLVTIGSPLSHGNLLMADKDKDFKLRIYEREYPTCPPILDGDNYTYGGNIKGKEYIHHATPFAAVRWSNIYYPGDFVGGKVAKIFGQGVKDFRVWYQPKYNFLKCYYYCLSRLNPASHNHYWGEVSNSKKVKKSKKYNAIKAIYKAMRLDDIRQRVYGE